LNSSWPASILLAAVLSSHAQQPCAADPNAARNESTRFDNEEFNIKQREIQANVDYENAKLRCRDSQTTAKPKATGCMLDAQRKFQDAQNNIAISRNNNNATREKANIDSQSAVDECNVTGKTPAEQQENLRHFHAEIDLKKKLVDVNTTYANNKLACASKYPHDTYETSGSTDESRKTCLKNNEKSYASDQVSLQIDRNNENATHTKNLMTIQRSQQQPK
jgi:hypothetical protein